MIASSHFDPALNSGAPRSECVPMAEHCGADPQRRGPVLLDTEASTQLVFRVSPNGISR
jgi:hypothetical protein